MPGGWLMREVLLIDVALWVVLIMAAALIITRRWRRSHSRMPARRPRGEAPERTGQKMSAPKAASVTGLGADIRAPDGAAPRPARPPPAAPRQAIPMADPRPARPPPAAPPQAIPMADPRPARPPPAARPQATQLANPKARPRRPGGQRDGRRAPTRAATPSERIASYYDQADQPIADYLAALGWTQQPPTPPVRLHAQSRDLPQSPRTARPAP